MSSDPNRISKKKPIIPISDRLRDYLFKHDRAADIPIHYDDLKGARGSFPLLDKKDKDTLWETMVYDPDRMQELSRGLCVIYAQLRTAGDMSVMEHLYCERIDYCTFGNSNPFRIRIVNRLNDNYDHFYVKPADASRIYGLELEDILSPNRINYIVDSASLIEEHIAGIPGDNFIRDHMDRPSFNRVRIAKEFVKFNERCFVRLLGDMRAYNYVVDVTPDFEDEQYRIRAIDFDQQSYEGKKTLYMPQYFKTNNVLVKLAMELMTEETYKQYQYEERTLIARRLAAAKHQMKDLIDAMRKDRISSDEKVKQMREELAEHHQNTGFLSCKTMGAILRLHLKNLLGRQMQEIRAAGNAVASSAGYVQDRSAGHKKR